jgi:hypothetical protein
MLERVLSSDDARRTERTLQKLTTHGIGSWVLTGGLAVEIHCALCGCGGRHRGLNDIDFVTKSFDDVPKTLARDLLFRHVHPFDPPGKTILQAVDAPERLRVDVFKDCSGVVDRAFSPDTSLGDIRIVCLEDLIARMARLVLDLTANIAVPTKHAQDFLRLLELTDVAAVEEVWQDHRKANHPSTFDKARELLIAVIPVRRDLLITPDYSKDTATICSRCLPNSYFALAEPQVLLSLLGYC